MRSVNEVGQGRRTRNPDAPVLVDAFWRAASAMSGSDRYRDLRAPARAAAEALLRLASVDAEADLRAILRPDLDVDEVTWTVACFEIGCVAPAGLHQVATACDALASMVACDDATHVASELICSGPDGLQWVALVRSDRRFVFQFPDLGNVVAPDPTVATVAVTRWRRHLSFTEACLFADELPGDGPEANDALAEIDLAALDETSVAPSVSPSDTAQAVPPSTPVESAAPTPAPTPSATPTSAPSADPTDASPGTTRADLDDRRDVARRALRRAVAVPAPEPGGDAVPRPGDAITPQSLNAALRSAVAEVVPFLERYLLDAVSNAVVEAVPEGTHNAPVDANADFAKLVEALPEQVAAELRTDLRARGAHEDPDQLSRTLTRALRGEINDVLHDADAVQRERLRRLTDMTSTMSERQSELRKWIVSLRQHEDHLEHRFDQLDNHLHQFEQHVDDSLDQVRTEQRRLRESPGTTTAPVEPAPGARTDTPGVRIDRLAHDVAELRSEIADATQLLQKIKTGLFG